MLISVLMPVYNQIRYLPSAIDSILAQTYGDFEFIIIDDGSTEPVWDMLKLYQLKDSRIAIRRNKKNIGLTKSLNMALDMAKGDYFARMDGDDLSLSNRFEKQIEAFKNGIGLVTCWAVPIDKNNQSILPVQYEHEVQIDEKTSKAMMLENDKNGIIDPSAFHSRKTFEKIGYYDESLYLAQSYNYTLRILNFFDFRIIKEILYLRRHHSEATGVKLRQTKYKGVNLEKICRERANKFTIIKKNTDETFNPVNQSQVPE